MTGDRSGHSRIRGRRLPFMGNRAFKRYNYLMVFHGHLRQVYGSATLRRRWGSCRPRYRSRGRAFTSAGHTRVLRESKIRRLRWRYGFINWQDVLTNLGTTLVSGVVVVGAAAWVIRTLASHRLTRDMEGYKSQLQQGSARTSDTIFKTSRGAGQANCRSVWAHRRAIRCLSALRPSARAGQPARGLQRDRSTVRRPVSVFGNQPHLSARAHLHFT